MGAIGICIIGASGAGKSTSMRTLDPKSTYIINVQGKPLPFREGKEYVKVQAGKSPSTGNMFCSDDVPTILKVLRHVSEKMPDIKTIVVDDWQYCAANEYMRKVDVKGFDKFSQIGKAIWEMSRVSEDLREDLIIYYLTHTEEVTDASGVRRLKAKTIGKMVDNVVTLEGMFTIVLLADVEMQLAEGKKVPWNHFVTQNSGDSTAKSPMGMFADLKINNDLNAVAKTVREYYGIN